MNILVFTPLYYIDGREDLIHDTNAIHYLVKYWAKNNNVLVINTYLNYRNKIGRYLKKQNRDFYKFDYCFFKDDVKVYIIENQILTKGRFIFWNWQHCIKHIQRILESEKFSPDIVISHFPCYSYGFIDKLNLKVPVIAVVHESDVVNAKANKTYFKSLENKYSAVYCRSKKIYNYFALQGLNNLHQEIIYSGAPKYELVVKRNWCHFRNNIVKVLFVGKLIKRKNVDWIIRALYEQSFKQFKLEIIGSGKEESNIKALVSQLGMDDRITFIESLPRDQVLKKMESADIFCMPSINETFGLVYIEALSRGCLTIGSVNEGIDGVIKDSNNGFLVSSCENLVELFRNIFSVMPIEKIQMISDKAVETGSYFSEDNVSKRYFNLIKTYVPRYGEVRIDEASKNY